MTISRNWMPEFWRIKLEVLRLMATMPDEEWTDFPGMLKEDPEKYIFITPNLGKVFGLTPEQMAVVHPATGKSKFSVQVDFAKVALQKDGFILDTGKKAAGRKYYKIAAKGLDEVRRMMPKKKA